MEPVLISSVADLPADFRLDALPPREPETAVLMADPAAFRIAYVINPHMADAEGRLKQVDPDLARSQWEELRASFAAEGLEVRVLPAEDDLPDLVFTANQSLVFRDARGRVRALKSRMRAPERRPEAEIVADFHRRHGIEVVEVELGPDESLEGAGDLLLVPGRRFCLAGVGPRTSRRALDGLPELLGMPVAVLELAGETFYHLDTCVCPLDSSRVLAWPDALTEPSRELLERLFDLVLVPAPEEAEIGLACNAVACPSGLVLVEETCPKTRALLELQGYRTRALPSSEFLKSGGSLFCMKLLLP